jgi:putative peptidoglycan lipid II flippase
MSQAAVAPIPHVNPPAIARPAPRPKSFLHHAKLIGFLTLISRFFGLGREIVATHYLGTDLVGTAFSVAFAIPNLFRKLFGEGALSAAFIPLYAQQVKHESTDSANHFAAAAVNLLVAILIALTIVGEIIIGLLWVVELRQGVDVRQDRMLTLKLAAIMLPYVLLICGGAFLSGILQVHKRFGVPAATPIILNAVQIVVLLVGARLVHLSGKTADAAAIVKQTRLAYALGGFILVAGVLQVAVLLPALSAAGFRFRFVPHFWTPAIKTMLVRSLPVALGAGVLQISVLLDKGISLMLMQGVDKAGNLVTSFHWFGHLVRYPMELGAPRRLDLAQFLYQFPLGIFAIALATAIFPGLSADALEKDRTQFRAVLRQGIEASLWEGLPASVGLMLVASAAARLLFQHGQVHAHDAELIARSTVIYAAAIWAFSLLQIINRAYYAVHDTVTPLVMSMVNIVLNVVVEVPLVWTRLGESGMAVGTVVSFAVQALLMLWMLDRRIGGLHLRRSAMPVAKMLLATAVMGAICLAIQHAPLYPHGITRLAWAQELAIQLLCGATVYLLLCRAMGVQVLRELLPHAPTATPTVPISQDDIPPNAEQL